MPAFHVFVEGARDRSPSAIAKLAAAIGARYGVPAPDVESRLARGRFRVKANVDRATADQYARDLERLGAVVAIVDASSSPLAGASGTARPTSSVLPPKAGGAPARAPSMPLPAPVAKPVAPASGLAAARAGAAQDLGALGRDDGAIALATLDGGEGDDEPMQIDPSPRFAGATPPPAAAASETRPSRPATPVPDMFDAPDSDDLGDVQLAIDVDAERAKRAASAAEGAAAATLAPERATLTPAAAARLAKPAVPFGQRVRGWIANARVRFAAGVVVAVLVGFIPAHVVAAMREGDAFTAVDRDVIARQARAQSPDEYAELDRMRARMLDRKASEQRDIAITAMLIWAAAGAAIAYVWFRRVPWDRLARG